MVTMGRKTAIFAGASPTFRLTGQERAFEHRVFRRDAPLIHTIDQPQRALRQSPRARAWQNDAGQIQRIGVGDPDFLA
jgi:hypothetical protein